MGVGQVLGTLISNGSCNVVTRDARHTFLRRKQVLSTWKYTRIQLHPLPSNDNRNGKLCKERALHPRSARWGRVPCTLILSLSSVSEQMVMVDKEASLQQISVTATVSRSWSRPSCSQTRSWPPAPLGRRSRMSGACFPALSSPSSPQV